MTVPPLARGILSRAYHEGSQACPMTAASLTRPLRTGWLYMTPPCACLMQVWVPVVEVITSSTADSNKKRVTHWRKAVVQVGRRQRLRAAMRSHSVLG